MNDIVKRTSHSEYVFEAFTWSRPGIQKQRRSRQCMPKGRSGHRVIADENYLYTFGGYNPDNAIDDEELLDSSTLFKEVWRMNIHSNKWNLLNVPEESFPDELASAAVTTLGSFMVVHGGTGIPFGANSGNTTFALNLKQPQSLTALATTGKIPQPLYGQAIAVDKENNIYLVGGTSGIEFFMEIHRLNLENMEWSHIRDRNGSRPDGRYRHEIAIHNSKILVFGGGTLDRNFGFQTLPRFDLISERWDEIPTEGYCDGQSETPKYPQPRRCHAGVMIPESKGRDARYVIFGGYNGRRPFSDIWSLNLRTRKWTKWDTRLPRPLHFHDAAITPQGKILIFGGILLSKRRNRGTVHVRTNQVLSCWVTVPKLSDMAWEAVLHYCSSDNLEERVNALLSHGLPKCYYDRISER